MNQISGFGFSSGDWTEDRAIWAAESRAGYNHDDLRYPSDATDQDWALIEPSIPPATSWAKGFVLLPRRWIVERTIAWLYRCRRLAEDLGNRTRNAIAF